MNTTHVVDRMPARLLTARCLLGALTATGLIVGGWAYAAPAAFYRSFPGFGRHWLPPLGPFNEHLIRDFGALNLGIGAAALVAAVTLTRSATVAATAAWLVYSVPHLAFHAVHGRPFDVGDDVAVLATLGAGAVAAALALWLVATAPARRFPSSSEKLPNRVPPRSRAES